MEHRCYFHLNANWFLSTTCNQMPVVPSKCCIPHGTCNTYQTCFHNNVPEHSFDNCSHEDGFRPDKTGSLADQAQSMKGMNHGRANICFVPCRCPRDTYRHMIHHSSEREFCLDIQNKPFDSDTLCKMMNMACTSSHPQQSIVLEDTEGHSVPCPSNSSQYGKYHIFAKRNICYKHEHSVYIHC